jgi:hypothetical protein
MRAGIFASAKRKSTSGDFDKKRKAFLKLEKTALKLNTDLKAYLKSVRQSLDVAGKMCTSLQGFYPETSGMGKACASFVEVHNDCNSGQLNEIISTVEGPITKKLDSWIADFESIKKTGQPFPDCC